MEKKVRCRAVFHVVANATLGPTLWRNTGLLAVALLLSRRVALFPFPFFFGLSPFTNKKSRLLHFWSCYDGFSKEPRTEATPILLFFFPSFFSYAVVPCACAPKKDSGSLLRSLFFFFACDRGRRLPLWFRRFCCLCARSGTTAPAADLCSHTKRKIGKKKDK